MVSTVKQQTSKELLKAMSENQRKLQFWAGGGAGGR